MAQTKHRQVLKGSLGFVWVLDHGFCWTFYSQTSTATLQVVCLRQKAKFPGHGDLWPSNLNRFISESMWMFVTNLMKFPPELPGILQLQACEVTMTFNIDLFPPKLNISPSFSQCLSQIWRRFLGALLRYYVHKDETVLWGTVTLTFDHQKWINWGIHAIFEFEILSRYCRDILIYRVLLSDLYGQS